MQQYYLSTVPLVAEEKSRQTELKEGRFPLVATLLHIACDMLLVRTASREEGQLEHTFCCASCLCHCVGLHFYYFSLTE